MGKRNSTRPASRPRDASAASAKASRQTRDVGFTMVAVIVAVWAGARWLTPLLLTAPIAWYLARGAAADRDERQRLTRRWCITVFVMYLAATAFASPNAITSVPFGADLPMRIDAWLAGNAGPVLGARYMLIAGVATLGLAAASAGIAGALVLASILSLNAVAAGVLMSRGYNVVQMAFVAVSPWQWCFMVGLIALYTPLSILSRERILSRDGAPFRWQENRTQVMIGGGLLLLAFILRFALAVPYAALARTWTL